MHVHPVVVVIEAVGDGVLLRGGHESVVAHRPRPRLGVWVPEERIEASHPHARVVEPGVRQGSFKRGIHRFQPELRRHEDGRQQVISDIGREAFLIIPFKNLILHKMRLCREGRYLLPIARTAPQHVPHSGKE